MRTLMWFTVGFGAACGLCAYGSGYAWMLPGAAAAVVIFVAVVSIAGKRKLLPPSIAVLAGCMAGFLWFGAYHLAYLRPVTALDGQEMHLTVTASDYSYDTGYGTAADSVVTIAGRPYQIRAYLTEQTKLKPGDTLEGVFRLRLTAPDEKGDSTYFQGKGIFLLAYQRQEVTVSLADEIPKWCFPAVLRQRILSILEEVFSSDTSPFAKALLLGDGRDLDYGIDTAFKIGGIRHIIAVSGLHISILYGLICLVTLRRRFLTAAVGMSVLLLFAAVAGFTPSVTRACIMVLLMLLAMAFDREYDAPTALAFAVLVMLVCNPLAVTSVSLQLSAGCVAGILLFNRPINSWLKGKFPKKKGISAKLTGMFCSSTSVTVSAMTLVTPLSAFYFGTVSLISVLTNLLTLWVVNLVFNGLVVTCAVYLLHPGIAAILANILAWPIRYVLLAAKTLAKLPLAAVYTKSIYIVLWLVFVYVLLAAFLLMKKKQPGVLVCCGAVGLCIALLASWWEPLMTDARITMLDVGQGQAILLQSEGRAFLVDCGGDSDEITADTIAETLLSQGVTRLDGIVITHYDKDHAGALHNLLTRVDTDHLFLPDTQNDLALPETTGEIVYVWEDVALSFGDARMRICGPVYSGMDNENSLCVLFDTEKCDILITGDRSAFGERMLLRRRDLVDVDILVAGHHGAAESTSEELLNAVRPETVLISAAQDNIYGHPSEKLLQRLGDFGCTVYRTDLHGTITIGR